MENKKSLWLDKTVFVFIFIFLGSLSVSIFVNQVGYYGALIFLLIKYYQQKENPFSKNGLEIYFGLYFLAEVLATIFSVNQGQSFHNLLKRFLLIPIVYTIVAGAEDYNKAKFFLKTYIGFALVSCILYLAFSVRYLIYNLYQIEQSGPSLYQYPITTSELMSFSSIILFAFIFDKKNKLKHRLWCVAAFIIVNAALFATYKRTGWIGTVAGLITVLIIYRKWIIIAPMALAVLVLFVFEKEKSEVYIFDGNKTNTPVSVMKTAGRATDVLPCKNGFWLADYENGIVKYENNKPAYKVATPSPVQKLDKIDDTLLLAGLIDSRFILYKNENNNKLTELREFASPGFTTSYSLIKNSLYIMDRDSGLTVFPNYKLNTSYLRFQQFTGYESVMCDSLNMVVTSAKKGIAVFALENNLPGKLVCKNDSAAPITFLDYAHGNILTEDESSVKLYSVENSQLKLVAENKEMKGVYQKEKQDSVFMIMNTKAGIFTLRYPFNNKLEQTGSYKFSFLPVSFSEKGGSFYLTKTKNSRFASIYDPYNPSNTVRIALWKAGFKIFRDHPVFGVGDIDLANLYRQYKHFYDKEIQGHMHNNYVHLLVTLGLFGFIIVMLLLAKLLALNIKICRYLKNEVFSSSYAAGVVGCFISFLVAGLTEWNFGDHEIITMVWFLTGLNIAFYNLSKKKNEKSQIV